MVGSDIKEHERVPQVLDDAAPCINCGLNFANAQTFYDHVDQCCISKIRLMQGRNWSSDILDLYGNFDVNPCSPACANAEETTIESITMPIEDPGIVQQNDTVQHINDTGTAFLNFLLSNNHDFKGEAVSPQHSLKSIDRQTRNSTQ
jgi:hypothetical protein